MLKNIITLMMKKACYVKKCVYECSSCVWFFVSLFNLSMLIHCQNKLMYNFSCTRTTSERNKDC